MFTEARKLSLIEAIIKSSDDSMLIVIEGIMKKENHRLVQPAPTNFADLVGALTVEEADFMKKTIDENFEKINPDDWK